MKPNSATEFGMSLKVRDGMSYPKDQSVHQTIDACALKLGATTVLHQLGVRSWDANRDR